MSRRVEQATRLSIKKAATLLNNFKSSPGFAGVAVKV
jgi:hypothetical protein